jgi:hypothetical protein
MSDIKSLQTKIESLVIYYILSDLLYFGINYFERGQYSISLGARIVQPFFEQRCT